MKNPSIYLPLATSFQKEEHRILFQRQGSSLTELYTVDEFEDISGMRYLPQLGFKSLDVYNRVKRECQGAKERNLVTTRAVWLGERYNQEIYSGAIHNVSIRWVDETKGYGLFAEEMIHPEEYIGQYTGMVKAWSFFSWERINEYFFRYPIYHTWFTIFSIDAKFFGNETSFINHSNVPNTDALVAWSEGLYSINIVALRPIAKGEEITYDYGRFS